MMISIAQLARVREFLGGVLEGLGLDAYLFEIEPRDGQWEMRVECAIQGGWESVNRTLDGDLLLKSIEDEQLKQRLIAELEQSLGHCVRRDG